MYRRIPFDQKPDKSHTSSSDSIYGYLVLDVKHVRFCCRPCEALLGSSFLLLKIMICRSLLHIWLVFLVLYIISSITYTEAKVVFFIDTGAESLSGRVLGVFTSTSRQQCAHRCKRTDGCVQTAMVYQNECRLLKERRKNGEQLDADKDRSVTISSMFQPIKPPMKPGKFLFYLYVFSISLNV